MFFSFKKKLLNDIHQHHHHQTLTGKKTRKWRLPSPFFFHK